MSLGKRLALGALLLVFVVSLTSFFAADSWLRPALQNHLVTLIENEAKLAAQTVAADRAAAPNPLAHRLGQLVGRRVSIIDSTGRVVGDSDFDDASLALLDNHIDRPEIVALLEENRGVSLRHSASTNRTELKVVVSGWPGFIRVSTPLDQIETIIGDARKAVLLAGFFALGVALILALAGERMLRAPLKELAEAARAVAMRENVGYPNSNVAEIRELVGAFRLMDEELETRIRDLRGSRSDTEAVLQSLAQGVLAVDADGAIRFANAAARDVLSLGSDGGVATLRDVLRSSDERHLAETVIAGQAVDGYEFAHGSSTLLASARPLKTGGAVLGFLDITDLKRIQSIRRDFVANVSHELKTPLTSILGYSETLLGGGVDREDTSRFLTTIHDNSKRMQRLVDELLDLARIESGSWRPNPGSVSLQSVAEQCWRTVQHRSREGVAFKIEIPANTLTITADQDAITQILTNLLENAIRHTNEGTITLSAARSDGEVAIAVTDTGVGIAPEHLPRLFERFYRADPARSREEGGTGLGLSIVKHLVEAQGGTVEVSSVLGSSSTFTIRLPQKVASNGDM